MSSNNTDKILQLAQYNRTNESSCLWSAKNISFGISKNKFIETMIQSNKIKIRNKPCREAFYVKNRIVLPLKSQFAHESHYYHLVLHEYAHFKAEQLEQSTPMKNAFQEYFLKFRQPADTDKLISQIKTKDDLLSADKVVHNMITSYLHEEIKCEVAAFQVMEHAKMKITPLNEQQVVSTFNLANRFLSVTGRNISEEFQNKDSQISKELKTLSDSMCKDYDMAKERVLAKSREREL